MKYAIHITEANGGAGRVMGVWDSHGEAASWARENTGPGCVYDVAKLVPVLDATPAEFAAAQAARQGRPVPVADADDVFPAPHLSPSETAAAPVRQCAYAAQCEAGVVASILRAARVAAAMPEAAVDMSRHRAAAADADAQATRYGRAAADAAREILDAKPETHTRAAVNAHCDAARDAANRAAKDMADLRAMFSPPPPANR